MSDSAPANVRTAEKPGAAPQSSKGVPRLKQIHWEKLDNVDNTIWSKLRAPGEPSTDKLLESTGVYNRMSALFFQKEAKKIVNAKARAEQQAVSILRDNVKQSVDINFHRFRAEPIERVVLDVLHCAPEVISNLSLLEYFTTSHATEIGVSIASKLMPYSSTPWNKADPHEAKRDPKELRRADHIFLELFFNLRHYWIVRSRGLVLSQTYDKEYQSLVQQLTAINDACEAATNSRHFHKLLEIILLTGNHLNGPAKQARGFKLSFLQNISVTKDDSSTITFLHFIEYTIRTGLAPETAQFTEDLAPAVKVSDTSIETLRMMCHDLMDQIEGMNQTLTRGILSDSSALHPEDRCASVIRPAIEKAIPLANDLRKRLSDTEQKVKAVMELYGEDYTSPDAVDSFFDRFASFVCMYKQAREDNIHREEEKRIYERRQEQHRERERRLKELEESAAKEGRTNADTVIERLKNPETSVSTRSRRRAVERPEANHVEQAPTDDDDVADRALELLKALG